MLSSTVSLGPPRPSQVHVFHELAHVKCEPFLEVFWIGFLDFGVFLVVWCFGGLVFWLFLVFGVLVLCCVLAPVSLLFPLLLFPFLFFFCFSCFSPCALRFFLSSLIPTGTTSAGERVF